jgi:hypothetical protein
MTWVALYGKLKKLAASRGAQPVRQGPSFLNSLAAAPPELKPNGGNEYMTEEQKLEETIQADFDTLAHQLGVDVLGGLAKNYPREFSHWMSDLKFAAAARYVISFQAQLQPIDEAKADLVLASSIIAPDEEVH